MNGPKLTLVGAGPGDPGLITLKGLKALQAADIVLYDALVSPGMLDHIPVGTPRISVGKRKGASEMTQEEINALIRKHALTGHVVRLKGGDPFIFGRGFEEMLAVRDMGIPAEYIPGISSSSAVAGLQGIPLTHRGTSESFWVITGTTASGEVSSDLKLAATTDTTVVILMGFGQLQKIVDVYLSLGRDDLPVAVIQSGSRANENIALGTIREIIGAVADKQIGTPAVIIVGNVVKLHPAFSGKEEEWKNFKTAIAIEDPRYESIRRNPE